MLFKNSFLSRRVYKLCFTSLRLQAMNKKESILYCKCVTIVTRKKKSTKTVAIILSWAHQLAKSNACSRAKAVCAFGRICVDQLS